MIKCLNGKSEVLSEGASEGGNLTMARALDASYYTPPYAVNNGDNRYNVSYKTVPVTARVRLLSLYQSGHFPVAANDASRLGSNLR